MIPRLFSVQRPGYEFGFFFQASKDKDKLRKFLDEGTEITKTMLNHHGLLNKASGEIEEAAAKTTMQIENRIEQLTRQVTNINIHISKSDLEFIFVFFSCSYRLRQ